MNKKLWWIIGAVVIIIAVLIGLKKSGAIGKEEGVKVAVEKITLRTIVETVSASGKVYPEDERKVSSDVSGEIVDLYVLEGDSVKKGQILARVFADVLTSNRDRSSSVVNQQEAQVGNVEASIGAFEARLNQSKLNYDRQKKLLNDKVISKSEFEQAESQYLTSQEDLNAAKQTAKSAKAGVQSAKADLNAANKNLSRTTIISPMDGIVSLLAVKKGERVAGNSFSLGTEIMRVADMNRIEVRVDVGENDIPKVHFGDTAVVEVDAYNKRKFKGIVTKIASSNTTAAQAGQGASSTDVTNHKVHIRLLPESYRDLIDPTKPKAFPFRPGMNASADIQTRTNVNVIAVPINAVTTRDKNSENKDKKKDKESESETEDNSMDKTAGGDELEEVVFIYQPDGKVKKVKVSTDIQDINYIQIVSGLKVGDVVVTGPYSVVSKTLKDGNMVKVTTKDKVFETKKE